MPPTDNIQNLLDSVQESIDQGTIFEQAGDLSGQAGDLAEDLGNQEQVQETVETPTSPDMETGAATVDISDMGGADPVETEEIMQQEGGRSADAVLSTILEVSQQEDPEVQRQEQQLREMEQQVMGVQEDVAEQPQERAQLEQEAGIGEFEQQIQDINSAIQTKSANLTAELNELGQQGFRATAVRGQEARARRQTAAEISGLQAAGEAAKNNIIAANSKIERALNAKYGDIESRLQVARAGMDITKSRMTRAEQKAARKRNAEITVLENILQNRRTQEQSALETVNTAIQNGVMDARTGSRLSEGVINGSVSPEEAQSQAGAAIGRVAQTQRQLENTYQRLKIGQMSAEIGAAQVEEQNKKAQETEAALNNLQVIENIYNKTPDGEVVLHDGFNESVGFGLTKNIKGLFGADTESAMPGTAKADFIATHRQIKDSLTLDNLDLMSGVLSESDIQILANAATRLDLSMSEQEYLKELDNIHSTFERTVQRNGITNEQAQFYFGLDPEDMQGVNEIYGDPTDDTKTTTRKFDPRTYYLNQ